MALKSVYETVDAVPEALREHYAEKDGKFHLAADGMVAKERLDEFRERNITTSKELDAFRAQFDGIDPAEARKLMERSQKERDKKLIDAGKVDELVAERVAAMRGEHDKVVAGLNGTTNKLTKQLEGLLIDSALRDAAAKSGVKASAVEDVLLRGRQVFRLHDGNAVAMDGERSVFGTDGEPLTMAAWVGGLAERASHLFEPSQGGGASKANPGAPAGKKSMTRAQFEALPAYEKATAAREASITD